MRVICIDDEPLAVEYTLKQCAQLPEIDAVKGFTGQAKQIDDITMVALKYYQIDNNLLLVLLV